MMGQRDLFERAAAGCVSKISSPSGNMIQGCLLRVQKCAVGRSQEVSCMCRIGRGVGHYPRSMRRKSNTHTLGRPNRSLLARFRRWSGGFAARPP
jgi:hypothetical protein